MACKDWRMQIDTAQLKSQISLEQILHCQHTLANIRNKLTQSDQKDAPSLASQMMRTVKWPFTSSEMDQIMDDFAHYKATFALTLSMDILEATLLGDAVRSSIANDVQQIKNDIYRIELTKEKRKALDFFTTPSNLSNHRANVQFSRSGTGTWLTQGISFGVWMHVQRKNLWMFGIPGAGKSIMCAIIIEHIRASLPALCWIGILLL